MNIPEIDMRISTCCHKQILGLEIRENDWTHRNCVHTSDREGLRAEPINFAELVDWIQYNDRSTCCATSQERIGRDVTHACDRIWNSASKTIQSINTSVYKLHHERDPKWTNPLCCKTKEWNECKTEVAKLENDVPEDRKGAYTPRLRLIHKFDVQHLRSKSFMLN